MLDTIKKFPSLIETLCDISSLSNTDIDDDTLKNVIHLFKEYHIDICNEFDEKLSELIKIAGLELNKLAQNHCLYYNSISVNQKIDSFDLLFNIRISDLYVLSQEQLSKISSYELDFNLFNFYSQLSSNILNKIPYEVSNKNIKDIGEMIDEYTNQDVLKINSDESLDGRLLTTIFERYNEIYKYSINELENVYNKLKEYRDFTIDKIQKEFPLGKCTIGQMSLMIINAIIFISKSYIVLYEVLNLYLSILYINTKYINTYLETAKLKIQ